VPKRIDEGYHMAENSGNDENVLVITSLWLNLFLVPFNAVAVYAPRCLRRFWGWVTGGDPEEMRYGAVFLSPIVAYGLSKGYGWASAVFGHEVGHLKVLQSACYDWWYWLRVGVVVATAWSIWWWTAFVSIQLVDEFLASMKAESDGYVFGSGGLILMLAWSTYLFQAMGVWHDVRLGLDPARPMQQAPV
jgi:hypothetical protein